MRYASILSMMVVGTGCGFVDYDEAELGSSPAATEVALTETEPPADSPDAPPAMPRPVGDSFSCATAEGEPLRLAFTSLVAGFDMEPSVAQLRVNDTAVAAERIRFGGRVTDGGMDLLIKLVDGETITSEYALAGYILPRRNQPETLTLVAGERTLPCVRELANSKLAD